MAADLSHQVRIDALLDIMRRLRDPETGCPWDIQQDFASIAPYTLEETYEVLEAIQCGEPDALCDELGDLLFQVVFHAHMATELDWFTFHDVVASISRKLVRRHPHVFADHVIKDAAAQTAAWEAHKAKERTAKAGEASSEMDDIPRALPALARAQKLQQRAARVGFDWQSVQGVIDKLQEEVDELISAREAGEADQRQREELGDVLFTCVNLARHLDADAEALLRDANAKFERRFRALEALAGAGESLQGHTPEALEQLWLRVKAEE